jgi:ketosteroid isomerase-like protein
MVSAANYVGRTWTVNAFAAGATASWNFRPSSVGHQKEVIMKKKFGAFVISVLVLIMLAALAGADDQQDITDLEHKLAAATSAQEAMQFYDSGDEVSLFDMSGPPREYDGQKAVRADLEKGFAGLKDLKANFLELKVDTDGQFGYARSVQHFTGKTADGKPVDVTFRQTDVLRKIDGKWKIVHQHISVPVDSKTGKPDMSSRM